VASAEPFEKRTAVVGIVGLGYVGLPLVRTFVAAGFRTLGFDIDAAKVERLARGESYIAHLPAEWIAPSLRDGRFEPTSNMRRLGEPDAVLICVPTPLTESNDPDLSFVVSTAEQIAAVLRPGQLVVLESTTYPGTTRDVVRPILERTGLVAGRDFFLAYSPEREDPGNPQFAAGNIPKVVGGIEPESQRLACALYAAAVKQVVPVSSCEVAEACKILENTYRAVNIALVNELKMLYDRMGIDVWEVIAAAATKPFGFAPFYPGPGLGGHCIPIDPFYLTWIARQHGFSTRFIELAGEVNTAMPQYVVERLREALARRGKVLSGSKVLLLGMAYKKDIDDPRESPGFELMELLLHEGASVSYNDPLIPRLPKMRRYPQLAMSSVPLSAEMLAGQDAVLIVTDHSAYNFDWIVANSPLVVDTRGATRNVAAGLDKIVKA
jgi:UDP-N-acetyl-D-glucosamine dehydrogenase